MTETTETPNSPDDVTSQENLGADNVAAVNLAADPIPAPGDQDLIETLVAEWKAELDGQQSVSATNVQDRLLDLWGRLPEGDIRVQIEQWLTETVQRHLYAVADIDARLQKVLASA